MSSLTPEAIITLQGVLGCSTAPSSLHSLSPTSLLYLAGNVGVVYDRTTRKQTLLRGHRNPVACCCLRPASESLLTACRGPESSIILWDVTGVALATVDTPHPEGTMAMDVSADGNFLLTLSVPFRVDASSESGGDSRMREAQELKMWKLPAGSPSFEMVAQSLIPVTDTQHQVTFNNAPTSSWGGSAVSPTPAAAPSTIQLLYEFATTGLSSVLFWAMHASGVDRVASTSTSTGAATHGMRASTTTLRGAPAVAVTGWTVSCSIAKVPNMPPAHMVTFQADDPGPALVALRVGGSTGGGGEDGVRTDAHDTTTSFTGAGGALSVAKTAVGGVRGGLLPHSSSGGRECTTTLFLPIATLSGSTKISAVTGTRDGTLILWSSGVDMVEAPISTVMAPAFLTPTGSGTLAGGSTLSGTAFASQRSVSSTTQSPPVMDADGLHQLVVHITGRAAAKTVKLSRPVAPLPTASAPASGGEERATSATSGVNTLNLSPCSRFVVVGSEDGAVRTYDAHMRLVAWWDEIAAGPITSLSFVANQTSGGGGGGDAAIVRGRSTHDVAGGGKAQVGSGLHLPDFLLGTRYSLLLALQSSSFESNDSESRKGEIILEGPDAAVVGIAAYPHPYTDLLAVAVASGCIQLWNVAEQQLLAVRELSRTHNFAAGSAAAAAAALQAPQVFHPTAVSIDHYARFLAVGTSEGFVCLLDPVTLTDTQAPLTPAQLQSSFHSTGSSTAVSGSTLGQATSLLPSSGGPRTRGSPITRLVFADDGVHLAAADGDRHVVLWRFTRQRTKQVSARATSRLGLGASGALLGRRHAKAAAPSPTASPRRPRPWELLEGDESGLEDVVRDSWTYMGRARTHAAAISGLSFTSLPPGEVSPHVYDREGGYLGGIVADSFWSLAGTYSGSGSSGEEDALTGRHAAAGISMLLSTGLDRRLVLYDVGASSVTSGLLLAGSNGELRQIMTQFACPTAAAWYPASAPRPDTELTSADAAACILVADDDYKLKLWSAGSSGSALKKSGGIAPACHKTVLAPTFGGNLTHLVPVQSVPDGGLASTPYMAFATDDRVLGLMKLPVSGNPYAAVGVVAHPGPVTGLAVSATGTLLFTCGSEADRLTARGGSHSASASSTQPPAGTGSVCIWSFQSHELERQVAGGGTGLTPFLTVLEGGREGEMYQTICDMFSYAQIRSQGEASTQRRRAGITLPLSEVAAVMRALGYYPTAADVTAMLTEVRGMNTVRLAKGEAAAFGITNAEQIDLQTLIQMYVNHRPVVATGADELTAALTTISKHVARTEGFASKEQDGSLFESLRWGSFAKLLATKSEKMSLTELKTCLTALLGPVDEEVMAQAGSMGAHFADDDELEIAQDIVGKILGFDVMSS